MTPHYQYGWKRDLPDRRDLVFTPQANERAILPPSIDLRKNCPPIYDQGNLGSCTANAVGAVYQYEQINAKKPNFIPSRLFIYYNTRILERTVGYDSGASIRNSVKTLNKTGVCPEKMWSYDIRKFIRTPPKPCYTESKNHIATSYARLNQTLNDFKTCLAGGDLIVFGFAVYESFETINATGIMPVPEPTEHLLGGHAVVAVGYDDSTNMFTIRNSWGSKWGDKGYFYMPYSYILNPNLCADFWKIATVRDKK